MPLATRIIPQLLFRGHQLVKGVAFDSWRSVGVVSQAVRIHQARGVDEVLLLDIGATAEGRRPNVRLVEQLAEKCFMPLTVGGGVQSIDDIRQLLSHGADKVIIGSAATENLIRKASQKFGSQAIVVSVDVAISKIGNWILKKDEHRGVGYYSKAMEHAGAGEILLQLIDNEGKMCGYDVDLIRRISSILSIPVIASCGCGTYEHMYQAIQAGAHAVSAGAMFQFTDQTPRGAAEYLAAKGIEVRL